MAKAKQTQKDNSEKVQSLFADYPQVKALYITADGMPFLTEAQAERHAVKLQDSSVKQVKR